jgi:1-acyl-sn-glycerol-3-phosphate acyltransferase
MHWQSLGENLPTRHNLIARWIGRSVFRALGWRIEGEIPNRSKMVVALVPHSSNMDFILTLAVLWGLGLRAVFMMKHSLFWFPLGGLLRYFGGIPVDRRSAQGLVGQMQDRFSEQSKLVLGITPEGTRGGATEFKTGFARIAAAAKVPVLPAILDYRDRTVRFAQLIEEVSEVQAIVDRVRIEAATGSPRAF